MVDQRKVPSYFYLPPDALERQKELTRNGTYDLLPSELLWKDRYHWMKSRGYDLRPRYSPDWEPSWLNTNRDAEFCEDSIMPTDPYVIDARRRSDGRLVAVKPVKKRSDELQISLYLSSLQDPSNHCVRVLDTFDDPLDQSKTLMVMEYLRPFNDPEFVMIGDVIDFVSQMLEGLAFLHNHRIAHRDIAPPNVMMDGSSLFPNGHHPVYRTCSLDLIEDLTPLLRIDHPVKYFYVDFGLSVRFKPGASSLVVGDVGRDEEVPELSSTVPYDAFKADIYALGNLFDKEFLQKYHGLEFLRDLIDVMKRQQPEQRPPVPELVQMFVKVRKSRNPSSLRWRLAPKSEPAYERLFNDTVAVAKNGLSQLRRFVQQQ
ncbi:kinase-like protein [Trametes coccinea BRFM310]|uniref:Kinase-like protein n=1 Tax=Trametes coccinea (strain BRFM310) TaxID=1353009 RepID=A0A1Y2ICC3_TRAC3|nr:kinase-like protein [Trametes coccinea BRFM310]